MESSIAVFLMRQHAFERLPTPKTRKQECQSRERCALSTLCQPLSYPPHSPLRELHSGESTKQDHILVPNGSCACDVLGRGCSVRGSLARAPERPCARANAFGVCGQAAHSCAQLRTPRLTRTRGLEGNGCGSILAEGAIALPVTLSGGALFAS